MILNSRNNLFVVNLPQNFIYPHIKKKWEPFFQRVQSPYSNIIDYLNSGIQSINMPGFSLETVEQVLLEDPVASYGGMRPIRYMSRDLTLTFKSFEGFVNYWMLYDQLNAYWDFPTEYPGMPKKRKYMPNITISYLDDVGFEFLTVDYAQIIMTGISELEFNYSSNTAEFKTFDINFKYNYITLKTRNA